MSPRYVQMHDAPFSVEFLEHGRSAARYLRWAARCLAAQLLAKGHPRHGAAHLRLDCGMGELETLEACKLRFQELVSVFRPAVCCRGVGQDVNATPMKHAVERC